MHRKSGHPDFLPSYTLGPCFATPSHLPTLSYSSPMHAWIALIYLCSVYLPAHAAHLDHTSVSIFYTWAVTNASPLHQRACSSPCMPALALSRTCSLSLAALLTFHAFLASCFFCACLCLRGRNSAVASPKCEGKCAAADVSTILVTGVFGPPARGQAG